MDKDLVAHHGKGVRYFRREDKLSIEQLAGLMGISANLLEDLEQEPRWEDKVLRKASQALEIPLGLLEMYYPEIFEKSPTTIINSNTFNDDSKKESPVAGCVNNGVIIVSSLDKVIDLYHDQVSDLKETITMLRKEIEELKKR